MYSVNQKRFNGITDYVDLSVLSARTNSSTRFSNASKEDFKLVSDSSSGLV